jgi:alpha-1,2-mannosyltransferase
LVSSYSQPSISNWLRNAPWITARRFSIYPKLFLAAYLLTYILWMRATHRMVDQEGTAIGADFINSWGGSYLALWGHPRQVFDPAMMLLAERAAVGGQNLHLVAWFYPPTFLLIVLPFALVPYIWALAGWTVATLTAYLGVLRKIAPRKETVWLALAFPGTWINLINGQNGLLTAALFGGGLLYLEQQPVLAGVLFGLLVIKPQLAITVPLVLVVSRRWRCLVAATVSSLVTVALSLLAFGPAIWRTFFNSIWIPRRIVLDRGEIHYYKQQSVFAVARLWGLSLPTAYTIQAVATLSAVVVLLWLWTDRCSYRLKAAALVVCALLATPYLFDYDLTLLGIGIAWLAIEGIEHGFLPFEKSVLAIAWLAPIVDRSLAKYALIPLSPLLNIVVLAFIIVLANGSQGGKIGEIGRIGPHSPTPTEF